MEFSNRDAKIQRPEILNNQSGQAVTEYILILVAVVALILGGLYQLNTAFKSYANNYFGNYLACLLEAGELPTIGGGGGDAGICNEIFKPFNLADGRKLDPNYKGPGESVTPKPTGGTREGGSKGSRVGGSGGGGGGGGSGSRFAEGKFNRGNKSGGPSTKKKSESATFTGNMAASDYGSANGSRRRINVGVKQRLDNRFAFQDERERPQRKSYVGGGRRPAEEGSKAEKIRVKRSEVKKTKTEDADTGLSIPNLLKWLIIAGIIVALFVFLGGQGLQINKSME